jgi:hypothetical protein
MILYWIERQNAYIFLPQMFFFYIYLYRSLQCAFPDRGKNTQKQIAISFAYSKSSTYLMYTNYTHASISVAIGFGVAK